MFAHPMAVICNLLAAPHADPGPKAKKTYDYRLKSYKNMASLLSISHMCDCNTIAQPAALNLVSYVAGHVHIACIYIYIYVYIYIYEQHKSGGTLNTESLLANTILKSHLLPKP